MKSFLFLLVAVVAAPAVAQTTTIEHTFIQDGQRHNVGNPATAWDQIDSCKFDVKNTHVITDYKVEMRVATTYAWMGEIKFVTGWSGWFEVKDLGEGGSDFLGQDIADPVALDPNNTSNPFLGWSAQVYTYDDFGRYDCQFRLLRHGHYWSNPNYWAVEAQTDTFGVFLN